jgi:hypothetical protein
MPSNESPESDAAACDFLDMIERDRRAGRLRPAAEYLLRFPGFEDRIARELAAIAGRRPGMPADRSGAERCPGRPAP